MLTPKERHKTFKELQTKSRHWTVHTKCLFLLGDGCYTVAARRAQLLRRVSHCGKFEIPVAHCGKYERAYCGKYERAHCGKYERVQLLCRVSHCGKSGAVKNWLLLEKVRKNAFLF